MTDHIVTSTALEHELTANAINIPEIYQNILSFLNIPTAAKLMRVSLLWYELAGPLLYRDLAYDTHGHRHPEGLGAFETLQTVECQTKPVKPAASQSSSMGKEKRTPKVELMKHCRILRMHPHGAFPEGKEIQCKGYRLVPRVFECLSPDTLILDMSKDLAPHLQDSRTRYHNFTGYSPTHCKMVQLLSPKKLIIKNWSAICSSVIGPNTFASIEKILIILSVNAFGALHHDDTIQITAYYNQVLKGAFWVEGDADFHTNNVIIFQGTERVTQKRIQHTLLRNWMEAWARELRDRHSTPSYTTTLVNAMDFPIYDDHHEPFPRYPNSSIMFPALLKMYFWEGTALDQSELEDRWSRVIFVTKEEYMTQSDRDLEGVSDDIEW